MVRFVGSSGPTYKSLGVVGLRLAIPLACLDMAHDRRYVLLHAPETTSPVAERAPAKMEEAK